MILYFSTAAQSQSWGQPFCTLSSAHTLPLYGMETPRHSRPERLPWTRAVFTGSLHLKLSASTFVTNPSPSEPTPFLMLQDLPVTQPHSFVLCPPSPLYKNSSYHVAIHFIGSVPLRASCRAGITVHVLYTSSAN